MFEVKHPIEISLVGKVRLRRCATVHCVGLTIAKFPLKVNVLVLMSDS